MTLRQKLLQPGTTLKAVAGVFALLGLVGLGAAGARLAGLGPEPALIAPPKPDKAPAGTSRRDMPLTNPDELRQWVLETQDNAGAPFVIIDKREARLWLYAAAGQSLGNTPVLLGQARGDASVPGIGERAMRDIAPHERTTPAGRFVAEAGHNAAGEDIIWVDYEAAVSLHRVRANVPAERRLQRLRTATPADNRISYGCINVPVDFYEKHIDTTLGKRTGVIYVLAEMPASASAGLRPADITPAVGP